ncbi:MAG: hypothetical protein ACOVP4_12830 [Bacteriovoracaceae bacterium]
MFGFFVLIDIARFLSPSIFKISLKINFPIIFVLVGTLAGFFLLSSFLFWGVYLYHRNDEFAFNDECIFIFRKEIIKEKILVREIEKIEDSINKMAIHYLRDGIKEKVFVCYFPPDDFRLICTSYQYSILKR